MRFEYHCPVHGRVSELRDRHACPVRSDQARCARPLTLVVVELAPASA
jgi:hypothetical protein